ncbi:MAG: hypothetical protein M1833_005508 [Piccolia ochrophora]|nr:MAG: hypothetical protein M1833_005508 [Piccolia ochrophora]
MATSVLRLHTLCISWLLLRLGVQAATVNYDFNITWVTRNPDGAFDRPTIGINNQWPIPDIVANKGDRVIVNVNNQLGNQSTGLHFHGLFQNGTTIMDGAAGVSHCEIPAGSSLKYNFTIEQPGTYWYHSHHSGQYPDGIRGALIVHDPDSPYKDDYDEELVLTLSDWYHDQMQDLIKAFISVTNPTGAEPVPNSALMNDTQNLQVPVQPGKTYLVRMVNMAAFAGFYLWFEDHSIRIVEVDGVYTEQAETDMIYFTAAQRYSFLLTTKDSSDANFAIVGSMDQDIFDAVPPELNPNVTGWLVYDEKKELPEPALLEAFDPFDDFTLVPYDGQELYDKVDYSIELAMKMDNLGDGANYAFFNDVTYLRPKVPTVFTAMTTGEMATNPEIYGVNSNAFVLKKDDVVEIILNSDDPGKHPFHLHGHNFQAVLRSEEEAGFYNGTGEMPKTPMRRDTFMVNPNGHKTLEIPDDFMQVCKDRDVPVAGNAAGNTEDLLDLTGAWVPPAPLPEGFTPRGIVALVFSILAAFIGMAVISWYGVGELGSSELASAQRRIAEAEGSK